MALALYTVEDTFGEDRHTELDSKVNAEQIRDRIQAVLNLSDVDQDDHSTYALSILLSAIVQHSGNCLNQQYCKALDVIKLVAEYPTLQEMLRKAWAEKKYSSIRLLEILQAKTPLFEQCTYILCLFRLGLLLIGALAAEKETLIKSFNAAFRGAAVDGFLEYLRCNEEQFRTAGNGSTQVEFYAKFCSIVQSSETGKSRLLTELSKRDVVLYFSLQGDSETGFPFRDEIPANILTSFQPSKIEYRVLCNIFFTALFQTLQESFADILVQEGKSDAVQAWGTKMCHLDDSETTQKDRVAFFATVQRKYNDYYDRRLTSGSSHSSMVLTSSVKQGPESKDSSVKHGTRTERESEELMLTAYRELCVTLSRIFDGPSCEPRLVIAIDEAHPLSTTCTEQSGGSYRPTDVLTKVITRYSHAHPRRNPDEQQAIWVVFASTTSRVADFSPPNKNHTSQRVFAKDHRLFQPYTQLGWDQHAPKLGEDNVNDISKISHISMYGRPLWTSLGAGTPESLLVVAIRKLHGETAFDPVKDEHALAVLEQRFALDVTLGHPQSATILENVVASHLRICFGTTLDRNWIYTGYPSEPLLSCAAAFLLHSRPDGLVASLKQLEQQLRQGMVNVGERGELASRLLWLLAKDLYLHKTYGDAKGLISRAAGEDQWNSELVYCKMIPVVDWLEFVFGERAFGDSDEERQSARDCFKDAYINFSHWFSMDGDLPGVSDFIDLPQWTLRHPADKRSATSS